jgi:hypothetical protein
MRIIFETTDTRNRLPFATSYPDLPKGDVPYINVGDSLHYMITATSFKGALRRAATMVCIQEQRKLNPQYKMDSDTARLSLLGGVKGSGASAHPNPRILESVRAKNPLMELHGSGAPAMTSGCAMFGLMISTTAIHGSLNNYGKVVFDNDTRLPIIRRSLLNDSSIDVANDISDPAKLMDDAEQNRRRSTARREIDIWRRLEAKQNRTEPLTKREITTLANAKISLKAELGVDFVTIEDAQAAYEAFTSSMTASGTSDVSEANLHSFVFVPPDTVWRHMFELNHPSPTALGLFLESWNHKTTLNPYIGGNIARGCGGYLEGTYIVKRQEEDGEWIQDCVISVKPNEGISLMNESNSSIVRSGWDAWRSVDITKFVFDYKEIRRILEEKPEGTEV